MAPNYVGSQWDCYSSPDNGSTSPSQAAPPEAQVTYYTLVPIPALMLRTPLPPQNRILMPIAVHTASIWQQQIHRAPVYDPPPPPPSPQLASEPTTSPQRPTPHGRSGRAALPVAPLKPAAPTTTDTRAQSADSHKVAEQRRRDRMKASEEELKWLVPAAGRQPSKRRQLREVCTELRCLAQGNEAVQQALDQMRKQQERDEIGHAQFKGSKTMQPQ
ncbi:hypothetical protein EJ03DRAFT_355770 [Teratosphaeria nubilosa]|uniref:BHLH domain-containing protein n=1 Tax=Teratosphaeria nubilosa TaxID=161662 RepID=A0A6G1KVJ0_9PEZI|nr:hypothetical protein EJ03DRAFT_355770 [Teratosphaeria nubilosa]